MLQHSTGRTVPSPPATFQGACPLGHFLFYGSWKAVGTECGTESREYAHQPVKCSAGLVACAGIESGLFNGLYTAHERILKCSLLWHWAVCVEALGKLNSRWKTPSNLLLAICHFWVLANKLNLQLIYNDLNSKKSSCTLISDAFPPGFASLLVSWAALFNLVCFSEYSLGGTIFGATSGLVGWSLPFLPLPRVFSFFVIIIIILIVKKMLRSTRFEHFYTPACSALSLSLFFSNLSWTQGPLNSLLGCLGWNFCSACRARPWSTLWEVSSLWFMKMWPEMVLLWKNSALLLSESSRRKWLISRIKRTGHFLAL